MDINNITLTGRLCTAAELKYTQSEKAYARLNLAVGRMKKEETDFISCIAWEKTAEIIAEHCRKGDKIAIVGRLQTGSYEKDDKKIKTTDVLINQITFLGSNKKEKNDKTESNESEKNITNDSDPFPF